MIEDNVCPEDYPVFQNGGLHSDLIVDENTYIVDKNGRVCITTTSNRWENAPELVKRLNQGYIRARFLCCTEDFLTYSNQIRLATEKEIILTKKWVDFKNCSYNIEKTGQFKLF